MRKFIAGGFLVAVLAATGVLMSSQSASAKVRLDNLDELLPFYARIERNEIFHNDQWAVIVFYRPPACVPADFDLLQQFDVPGAFGCVLEETITVGGFTLWDNGPFADPPDQAPTQLIFQGLGAVPVWFVDWEELQAVIAEDGDLTIGDLEGMDSLLKGTASSYHETTHPFQSNKNGMVNFTGEGTLDESGAPFFVHALLQFPKDYDPTTGPLPPDSLKAIQIRFE